jgi:hypothetical protein
MDENFVGTCCVLLLIKLLVQVSVVVLKEEDNCEKLPIGCFLLLLFNDTEKTQSDATQNAAAPFYHQLL